MTTVASATPRAAGLDPDQQRVIEEQRARRLHRLARRELWSVVVFAAGFFVVAGLMAALIPSDRHPGGAAVLLLLGAYAGSFCLVLDLGTGAAVPTQLILVPMLFVLPVGWVPLAAAAGILLGNIWWWLRGKVHLERVPLPIVNSWHAVGPALVLGLAGERGPRLSDWPLYLAALLAQFVFDTVFSGGREWLAIGVRPSVQLRSMLSVYAVDAAPAPIGLAGAFPAPAPPHSGGAAPPPLAPPPGLPEEGGARVGPRARAAG